jgi:hypothetical protein
VKDKGIYFGFSILGKAPLDRLEASVYRRQESFGFWTKIGNENGKRREYTSDL